MILHNSMSPETPVWGGCEVSPDISEMSYILCDMNCDQEINKSSTEEHCFDCLCVSKLVDEDQQGLPATKAWRSTSVVEGRGHPKTLSVFQIIHTQLINFAQLYPKTGAVK